MSNSFSSCSSKRLSLGQFQLVGAVSVLCASGLIGGETVQAEALPGPQARATDPSKDITPFLPPVPSPPQTEDDFIRQMAGNKPVVPTSNLSAPAPSFRPPGSVTQAGTVRPQAESIPTTPERILPTFSSAPQTAAVGNSDVGLRLFAPLGKPETKQGDRCESGRCPSPSPAPAETAAEIEFSQTSTPTATPAGAAPLPPLPEPPQPSSTTPAPDPLPGKRPSTRSAALNPPTLKFQAVDIFQGNENSARARVTGVYPLSPNVVVGGTIDFTDGNAFTDSPDQGISINELYVAAAFPGVPNLRFAVGQLDLTSYFDRNSFAKDGATHFFNPVFQTNPALAATGIGSRPAALVNWSITDYLEAKAAVFSSSRSISDFSLDGFAGEVGLRYGNFIVRGTFASGRDAGARSGFREIFQIDRGDGRSGPLRGDREDSYGINAEVFIPELKMGIFARYGRYFNRGVGEGGDTYSAGINFLDLLMPNDRLGIAYGRALSSEKLRKQAGEKVPDVFEVFYDFAVLKNLRLAFSYQASNGFSESIFGVRVKTEFDLVPPRR
jgi:hypothetical protein